MCWVLLYGACKGGNRGYHASSDTGTAGRPALIFLNGWRRRRRDPVKGSDGSGGAGDCGRRIRSGW